MRIPLLCVLLIMPISRVLPQPSGLNVQLIADYNSAEKVLELFLGRSGNPRETSILRGSRVAVATTALLAGKRLDTEDLNKQLEGIKFGHVPGDDVFNLVQSREDAKAIGDLLAEIRRRNFSSRVVATVGQLFPLDTRITAAIPMYVVAFGNENIDAYVRRIRWFGDKPQFVGEGEGEGELTIVLNIGRTVMYGQTLDEQFIATLSVVAHEMFHALFGLYKDSSPAWKDFHSAHRTYLDQLLDLTHNEGIAHYLSFEQQYGGRLPRDWDERVQSALEEFNRKGGELMATRITSGRAGEIIRQSNTSTYWESYGAITGLFIAMQIDRKLGRAALTETVAKGPYDFFRKYVELSQRSGDLPPLSTHIRNHVRAR